MENLKLTLVQADLAWEDPEANLSHFEQLIGGLSESTDLILLPEMFSTGFSCNPDQFAEAPGGPAALFMQRTAAQRNCAVTGSVMIREGKKVFNRLLFYLPDGTHFAYDKRHLFRLSEEYKLFSSGTSRQIISFRGWNILPLVCYDLRFPVWSKNAWNNGGYEYDLLLYVANWPSSRDHVWKTLLAARAIENQAYVAGVNRIGEDGNGTWHAGESRVVDAKGFSLWDGETGQEEVKTVTLSAEDLRLFREAFTVGMDWDPFTRGK
jgi:omega-amidase